MPTFPDPIVTKRALVDHLKNEARGDCIIKGTYRKPDECGIYRGCFTGSCIEAINQLTGTRNEHSSYTTLSTTTGIPAELLRFNEYLYEHLATSTAAGRAIEIFDAIPADTDLSDFADILRTTIKTRFEIDNNNDTEPDDLINTVEEIRKLQPEDDNFIDNHFEFFEKIAQVTIDRLNAVKNERNKGI